MLKLDFNPANLMLGARYFRNSYQITILLSAIATVCHFWMGISKASAEELSYFSNEELGSNTPAYPLISDFDASERNDNIHPSLEIFFLEQIVDYHNLVDESEATEKRSPQNPISSYPLVTDLVRALERDASQSPEENLTEETAQDSEYLIPPRILDDSAADPFATTLPLNGSVVSHLTEWEVTSGFTLGEDFDDTDGSEDLTDEYQLDAIVELAGQIEQSITRDNVFTIDRQGTYFQYQSLRTERQVTTTRRIPRTLFGFRLGLTLTANCLFPGTSSDDQCSYTPAVEIDPRKPRSRYPNIYRCLIYWRSGRNCHSRISRSDSPTGFSKRS